MRWILYSSVPVRFSSSSWARAEITIATHDASLGLLTNSLAYRHGRDVNDEAVLTPPADHGNPFARASASPAAGFAPSVPSVAATTSVGSCFSALPLQPRSS